jgi:hypothetical protein
MELNHLLLHQKWNHCFLTRNQPTIAYQFKGKIASSQTVPTSTASGST